MSTAAAAPSRRLGPVWLSALVVVSLIVALVVVGLIRLGLLTFAGSAPPTVRFQTAQPDAESASWTFDDIASGGLPTGSVIFGEPLFGGWSTRAEPDAPSTPNALCQTGTAEFPALALRAAIYDDVRFSTRFKPVSGRVDQAAGLIFRVQDERNYYVLRANALERNVNFYRYSGGRRSEMAEGPSEVASGRWQNLRLEARGQEFSGFLDDRLVVTASDATFPAGGIGLWTKADAHTCFDDVEVRPL